MPLLGGKAQPCCCRLSRCCSMGWHPGHRATGPARRCRGLIEPVELRSASHRSGRPAVDYRYPGEEAGAWLAVGGMAERGRQHERTLSCC